MARRSLISPAQLSKVLSKIAFNKAEEYEGFFYLSVF